MSDRRMDVLALCIERGGYRKGARVAEFIFEWEIATRSVGRDASMREVAAWWKDRERTAWRRLSEFRQLFPELGEHGVPSDLMGPLLARLRAAGARSGRREVPT